jgi:hypothetical protein
MMDTKIKPLNQPDDYYFCSICAAWHTDARKDHFQYRQRIKRDPNMITAPIVQPPHAPPSPNSHHSPSAILGSFDGAAGLWKNENELLEEEISCTLKNLQ